MASLQPLWGWSQSQDANKRSAVESSADVASGRHSGECEKGFFSLPSAGLVLVSIMLSFFRSVFVSVRITTLD